MTSVGSQGGCRGRRMLAIVCVCVVLLPSKSVKMMKVSFNDSCWRISRHQSCSFPATISPVLSHPSPSAGTQHSCQSCTISEAAGAAQSCPTVCTSHSPFSHPTLRDGLCASPLATSVLSEHFNFTRSIQSSLLVSCSQLDLSKCLFR